ncbi:type VI secretion system secreted protein VgrG [Pseudacidovorax intermedius]|uniref:Type VI secretion system secreted protein VgrG n=1 Tax=Pseudacidovorax intermedius TaxID=433924 RepID=A0A370F7C7_9BURK|nr:type VI secretion system Vgr family protein [Pseudacidovorax intermedius]RDI17357.1 type VI secretion system secreted protein VgrG [Pseudacidovorax intermedius]
MLKSRTLRVTSDAIPQHLGAPALEPVRLSGNEGLNHLFAYELLLKTPEGLNLGAVGASDFDLDAFIGREISCQIDLDGAGEFIAAQVGASTHRIGAGTREINALITDAQLWGEEGRHLQYRFTLRPWLHLASLSSDCKIYQNKTVVDILEELLGDYAFPVEWRLIEQYPLRDYQTQFNESDLQFFERLCQEWGINYFFEHSEGKHRLVLIDNLGGHRRNPSAAYQQVEYHAPGWKIDAEYIHAFVPHNQLTPGRYSTRDYDYTRPRADLSTSRRDPRPTGQADGEIYQWQASVGGSHYAQPRAGAAGANDPQSEGGQLALLRMQALRTRGSRARATGNLRGMVPGHTFALRKHPRQRANTEYLVLDSDFVIEDVAQESQGVGALADRRQAWRVSVAFTAHPMNEPLRPDITHAKPHTHGPQTALVVGPEGQNLWTDELGRIKVQFPWDRLGQKNQHSSCWVRVSSDWAGNQLGAMHVPRIGQEVIIDFIGGDPDLPICTGRVFNQLNLPPWRLPEQQALSGFRSRELVDGGGNSAAGRSNHLILDDSVGHIQAQLKSDHQHSSLSLGDITRIEDNGGRKEPRGEGFELHTEGHGVHRAGSGMLITTEPRARAAGHAKHMPETVERLATAQQQHEQLAKAAQQATAQDGDADQTDVSQVLKAQNDVIQGSGAKDQKFPELQEPHLVLASPAGIESTTSRSTHIASGEHTALTSGKHLSLSTAANLLASARDAIRLFAFNAGMRFVAAMGDIDLKALKNSIHIMAKLNIELIGNKISITAQEEVLINGGTSYTRWNSSGIENGTKGRWVEHAATHSFTGPASLPVPEMQFPEPKLNTVCKECLLRALAAGSAFARS